MNSAVAFLRPNWATARSASHDAPLVCSSAVPTLMPMPNSTIVPHGIRGWASFQVMMPMPGRNISATAASVVEEVSNLCRTPSVDQNASRASEIASSFFSEAFIGPRSASDLRICSRPPGISFTSAGIIHVITK